MAKVSLNRLAGFFNMDEVRSYRTVLPFPEATSPAPPAVEVRNGEFHWIDPSLDVDAPAEGEKGAEKRDKKGGKIVNPAPPSNGAGSPRPSRARPRRPSCRCLRG